VAWSILFPTFTSVKTNMYRDFAHISHYSTIVIELDIY
jgi:hypothetical protein